MYTYEKSIKVVCILRKLIKLVIYPVPVMLQNKNSNWQIWENIITYKMSFSPKPYQENTLPCLFTDEKMEKVVRKKTFLKG